MNNKPAIEVICKWFKESEIKHIIKVNFSYKSKEKINWRYKKLKLPKNYSLGIHTNIHKIKYSTYINKIKNHFDLKEILEVYKFIKKLEK